MAHRTSRRKAETTRPATSLDTLLDLIAPTPADRRAMVALATLTTSANVLGAVRGGDINGEKAHGEIDQSDAMTDLRHAAGLLVAQALARLATPDAIATEQATHANAPTTPANTPALAAMLAATCYTEDHVSTVKGWAFAHAAAEMLDNANGTASKAANDIRDALCQLDCEVEDLIRAPIVAEIRGKAGRHVA